MAENGLLQYIEGEHQYKTTEKGLQFLRTYEQMNSLSGQMIEQAKA